MATYSTLDFLREDYRKTLFPLSTTIILLDKNDNIFSDFIYQKILNKNEHEYSFLSQTRVFASKSGLHLRRTVKLDPVAEYFAYDIVHRNRNYFRKDFQENRKSFGYRFENGKPISSSASYSDFRKQISIASEKYKYSIKCDIATYFNSIYHHDIVSTFSNKGWSPNDIEFLGQFLREINAGRSVDCLPQGLYPCKMIGADFLKLIDNSIKLKSSLILRFMDDFYIFDDNENILNEDFLTIQHLIGERGLSLNSSKTVFGQSDEKDIKRDVDKIKLSLLRARRRIIQVSGVETELPPEYSSLSKEQIEYLLELLKEPDIDEADAELVLVLLRDHGQDVLEHMHNFLSKFPSLSRNVYNFSKYIEDKELLTDVLLKFSKEGNNVTEDQLFWITKIAEDYLSKTSKYSNLLITLYEHPEATTISKAKFLEIPETRFGISSLREDHLKTGKSDWLAWSSAAGTRNDTSISRNHMLSYFAKGSTMNWLISESIRNITYEA